MEAEGIEEPEQADAKREENEKGAAETDGMEDDERGNGCWESGGVEVGCS